MCSNSKVLILAVGITLCCFWSALAQKGAGNFTGMGQEPEKPSVITITGELVEIKTGPCENTTGHAYIGTHLYVKSTDYGNLLNIHLGAAYALEVFIARLSAGDRVEMQVFRTELLKPDNYIATQISANEYTVVLRDENLRPFWAGDSYTQKGRRSDFRRRGSW